MASDGLEGSRDSQFNDCWRRTAESAQQAVDRRFALPEHEPGPRARVLCRWLGGGNNHDLVALSLAHGDIAQLDFYLQEQSRGYENDRARPRRALCVGGKHPKVRWQSAHYGPAY